jgi:hypothetical protein
MTVISVTFGIFLFFTLWTIVSAWLVTKSHNSNVESVAFISSLVGGAFAIFSFLFLILELYIYVIVSLVSSLL